MLDLRGNQRTTQGEKSRKEGGKIFGGGSRTAVTITLLVKKEGHPGPGTIHYHDIGDFLSREEKLGKLVHFTETGPEWTTIVPNEFADWVNQRRSDYAQLAPLGDENAKGKESDAIFTTFSPGLNTARDAWIYSFSNDSVAQSMELLTETYETVLLADAAGKPDDFVPQGPKFIKWDAALRSHRKRGKHCPFDRSKITTALYRPFTKARLYLDPMLMAGAGRTPRFFPDGFGRSLAIVTSGIGSESGLSALMVDTPSNFDTLPKSQVFPLAWAEEGTPGSGFFENMSNEPQRREGVSTWAVEEFSKSTGRAVGREAIFFYVYGILHSGQFREAYGDNLVKERPRIPLPKDAAQFEDFSDAGRKLADLHLNYESVEPYPLDESCTRPELDPYTLYRVEKMRFPKGQGVKDRPSSILYNDYITLSGIPDETWDYMLSGKAALYWIIDRYKISRDADSGIINDPNDYSEDPRYILDLLKRIVTVSVKTLEIIRELPAITFD